MLSKQDIKLSQKLARSVYVGFPKKYVINMKVN